MNFEYVIFSLKSNPLEIRLGYIDKDLNETLGQTIHYAVNSRPVERYLKSLLYVDSNYNVCSKNLVSPIYSEDSPEFIVTPFPLEFALRLGDKDFIKDILPVLNIFLNTNNSSFFNDIKTLNARLNSQNYLLYKALFTNNSNKILCFAYQSHNWESPYNKEIVLITTKFNFKIDCFMDSFNRNYKQIIPITNIESFGQYFTIN